MLDGDTWSDSFTVQCDKENNPEPDIRAGLLTVDVQIRPVFPAEFVRIRFQQTPMQIG
jgi:phage tail sheath protein FI